MFRNRGERPEFNEESSEFRGPLYRHFLPKRGIYIVYDEKFLLIDIIFTIIIILLLFAISVLAYKPLINDPILKIKNNFFNIEKYIILINIILIGLLIYFTKIKKYLFNGLKIILAISVLCLIIMCSSKFKMDKIYNKEKFSELYMQNEYKEEKDKKKLNINLYEISLTNDKQWYINESIRAYNNFSIKIWSLFIVHLLVIIFNSIFLLRMKHIEEKETQLNKDDKILFDEEINIK